MAEESLNELVMNLINWIESLHERNLKYEAQVESLTRDLAEAQSSNEQLEARLSAYQHSDSNKTTITTVPIASNISCQPIVSDIHHQPQQQTIYQPITVSQQSFVPQPAPYVWTAYEPAGHEMQMPYYEHYQTHAFQKPQ